MEARWSGGSGIKVVVDDEKEGIVGTGHREIEKEGMMMREWERRHNNVESEKDRRRRQNEGGREKVEREREREWEAEGCGVTGGGQFHIVKEGP